MIDPRFRIRAEYGSLKEALTYCFFTLHLGVAATARQLEVTNKTVRRWMRETLVSPLGRADLSPECRGIGHDRKRITFRKINALRSLTRLGMSLSDPQTHYQAEVLAGIRRATPWQGA